MCARVAVFHSRLSIAFALSALVLAACGGADTGYVNVDKGRDDAGVGEDDDGLSAAGCDVVQLDGDLVVEHETEFTATYRIGAPYTRTIMIFGGEPVDSDNVLSNAYIIGLDKEDAQMLAVKYPDFYLCSSPGGMEASQHIVPYDLVPADCDVYSQLVEALRVFHIHDRAGGDRTSLRIEGAPLTLESVIEDATGADVTEQVHDQDFHLVYAVEQLTGESVLAFGTSR